MGYSKDEIVNKRSFSDLLINNSLEKFQQSFLYLKESGEERDLESELMRKDETSFPVLISSSAVYHANNRYIMSCSTVYDMTERKKMEEERI